MFLRALLQKDGVSRKSRVTTLFFTALHHPLLPGSRNDSVRYPGQGRFLPLSWRRNCLREGAIGISEVSHAMLNTDAIGWPYFPGAFLLESTIPNNLVEMLLCWLFVGFFFF